MPISSSSSASSSAKPAAKPAPKKAAVARDKPDAVSTENARAREAVKRGVPRYTLISPFPLMSPGGVRFLPEAETPCDDVSWAEAQVDAKLLKRLDPLPEAKE